MKILLIDGHALFREGLKPILRQLADGVCEILEAGSFQEGMRLVAQHSNLNLVLMELKSPGSEGAVSVKHFRKQYSHIPVVVVSSEESCRVIKRVLEYGANGFVCKSSTGSTLLNALRFALAGSIYVPHQLLHPNAIEIDQEYTGSNYCNSKTKKYGLTSRQMEVLRFMGEGLRNKEIAQVAQLAEGTVKVHVAAVYQTLGVRKRIDAIHVAKQLGLIGMT